MRKLADDIFSNLVFTIISTMIYMKYPVFGFALIAWTVGISYYQLKNHIESRKE